MVNQIESISFIADVAPGTVQKFTERVKGDATIERLVIRFYPGQELSLRVRPYVQHKGNKIEDLATYPEGTAAYLAGDDETTEIQLSCPVENDDEIVLYVENVDATYSYSLNARITLDYYGGKGRV